MFRRKVDFIGRQQEVDLLLSEISAWSTREAVFIHGKPGVGKTSIVNEANKQFEELRKIKPAIDNRQYWVFNLDLDDSRLQSPQDISYFLITQTGQKESFGKYVSEFRKWREISEKEKIQSREQAIQMEKAFVECYATISHDVRTVIFCDTTDAAKTVSAKDTLKYLIRLCGQLDNIIVLFSGRDANAYYKEFQQSSSTGIRFIDLPLGPLSPDDSAKYIKSKEEILQIVIEQDIKNRILFFSKGIPFLIDLAADGRGRDIPLASLGEGEISQMSQDEIEEKTKEFEAGLVKHILHLRRPLDHLSLVLSWVYPIDVNFCSVLLDLSIEEATKLLDDARNNVPYIKSIANGRVKLHDYMEDLVQWYVWPDVEEEQKKDDSKRAIDYLKGEASRLWNSFDALQVEEDISDIQFLEKESLLREYWQTSIQLWKHALLADLNLAESIFFDLHEKLKQDAHAAIREQIRDFSLQLIMLLRESNSPGQFGVITKYVHFLTHQEAQYLTEQDDQYAEAKLVLDEMIERGNISDRQRIGALIERGNVNARISKTNPLTAGLDDFLEAVRIAQENNFQNELGQAELEVGWAYSNAGDWTQASTYFGKVLDLALETKNQELEAIVLNEIAYIKFHEDPSVAISLCNSSIEIWIDLEDKFGLGRAYSNLGTLHYRIGDFTEAEKDFQRSLDIFEPTNNREWQAILYSWLGITYCSQAEMKPDATIAYELLQKAEALIRQALTIDIPFESPRNLNRLARVYRNQKRFDEAWMHLQMAYKASVEVPNTIYEATNLRDLSFLALELRKLDAYDNLREMLTNYEKRGMKQYSHAYGGALINIGVMSIYLGDVDFGFEKIADGLRRAAEAGRYANYTFDRTLQEFKKLVETMVTPNERQELAAYLRNYWEQKGLKPRFLEATRLFYKL